MTVLRVVVADDEPEVRSALVDLLAADPAVEVVGVAADTEEVVSMAALHRPDVVLMDFKMPNGGGAIATRLIRQRRPETRVVALSAYQDRATVLEMLGAGAVGYITKGSPAADISTAIRRAGEGVAVLSPAASAEMVSELGSRLREDEERTAHTRERIQRVKDAIDGNLRIEFQPIVDLACGAVVGVEALARFPGARPAVRPRGWPWPARSVCACRWRELPGVGPGGDGRVGRRAVPGRQHLTGRPRRAVSSRRAVRGCGAATPRGGDRARGGARLRPPPQGPRPAPRTRNQARGGRRQRRVRELPSHPPAGAGPHQDRQRASRRIPSSTGVVGRLSPHWRPLPRRPAPP